MRLWYRIFLCFSERRQEREEKGEHLFKIIKSDNTNKEIKGLTVETRAALKNAIVSKSKKIENVSELINLKLQINYP